MEIFLLHDEAFFARIIHFQFAGDTAVDEARYHIEQCALAAAAQSNDPCQLEVIKCTRNAFENLFRAFSPKKEKNLFFFLFRENENMRMKLIFFL